MSETPDTPPSDSDSDSESNAEQETKLISEQFDDFKEALEILYVIANISGRNQFTQNWSQAAAYIFGEQLIAYDAEGAMDSQAREERVALEVQAEERRIHFLEDLDSVEEKSVESGVLQKEYVQGLVEKWGRALSLHVYSAQIVDRFIPPPQEPEVKEEEVADEAPAPDPEVKTEAEPVIAPVVDAPAPQKASPEPPLLHPSEKLPEDVVETPSENLQENASDKPETTQRPVSMQFVPSKKPKEQPAPEKTEGDGSVDDAKDETPQGS